MNREGLEKWNKIVERKRNYQPYTGMNLEITPKHQTRAHPSSVSLKITMNFITLHPKNDITQA